MLIYNVGLEKMHAMNINDVTQWGKSVPELRNLSIWDTQHLDGKRLAELNNEILRDELNIKGYGDRKRILDAIQNKIGRYKIRELKGVSVNISF